MKAPAPRKPLAPPTPRKITIVGAGGAVGALYSASFPISPANYRISLVETNPERLAGLREGVRMTGIRNGKPIHIQIAPARFNVITNRSTDIQEPQDIIVVATKEYDAVTPHFYNTQIKPILERDKTILLPMHNGILGANYLGLYGDARIVFPVLNFGSVLKTPGHVHLTTEDFKKFDLPLAPIGKNKDKVSQAELVEVTDVFNSSGLNARISQNLYHDILLKLQFLVYGMVSAVQTYREGRKLIIGDVMGNPVSSTVSAALGEELKSMAKSLNCQELHTAEQMIERVGRVRSHNNSLSLDIVARQPLEHNTIFGNVIALAKQQGLHTPLMESMHRILDAINNDTTRTAPQVRETVEKEWRGLTKAAFKQQPVNSMLAKF